MHPRIEKFLMGPRFAAIEAEMRGEEIAFHVVIAKRIGNKITIAHKNCDITNPDELPFSQLKNIPVSLVITGKGILYRNVQADPDAGKELLLRKVLPNAKSADFFVSSGANSSGHFVAVARRDSLSGVIDDLKTRCSIVSVDVGVQCLQEIQFLLSGAEAVHCGNHKVTFNRSEVSAAEYDSMNAESGDAASFKIGEEEIPGSALVAFAIALRAAEGNSNSLIEGLKTEFAERRMFQVTLRAAIIFFLLVLCANFFLFSHYFKRQQFLEAQSGAEGNAMAEVHELQKEVETRSAFLEEAGLIDNSSFAWYADQLAHCMPEGIQLSQMNFSPRLKLAEEDTIGFLPHKIEISGNCNESTSLNRWIQFLQQQQWVSVAAIRSFEQTPADATGRFILDLELQ